MRVAGATAGGVRIRLLAGLGVAVLLAAVAATVVWSGGASADSPSYTVYRPPGLSSSKPVPLVISFAGQAFVDGKAIAAEAGKAGYVVMYPTLPEIHGVPWSASWKQRAAELSTMLDTVEAQQNIDPQRVFATGTSRGGVASYQMACDLSNRIAAIASVAASLIEQTCVPAQPVSVLEIHGLADTAVPFNGNSVFPPVPATISHWRSVNRCGAASSTRSQGRVTTQTWQCAAGTEVGLTTIQGLGHGWPLDVAGFDPAATIWAFFQSHPRVAAPPPLSASLLQARVTRTSRGRQIAVRVRVNQAVRVSLTLLRRGRRIGGPVVKSATGLGLVTLPVGKSIKAGSAVLQAVFATPSGARAVRTHAVRLPAA